MDAAHQFLHSDLENIKIVVSKWARSRSNHYTSRRHIGFWEYSARPIARPTAKIIVPPDSPPELHESVRHSHLRLSSLSFSYKRTANSKLNSPASTTSQETKLSDLVEALELEGAAVDPGRSLFSMSDDSTIQVAESLCVSTPDEDWDPHFDYFGLSSSRSSEDDISSDRD
jgi:hypothetical protein